MNKTNNKSPTVRLMHFLTSVNPYRIKITFVSLLFLTEVCLLCMVLYSTIQPAIIPLLFSIIPRSHFLVLASTTAYKSKIAAAHKPICGSICFVFW